MSQSSRTTNAGDDEVLPNLRRASLDAIEAARRPNLRPRSSLESHMTPTADTLFELEQAENALRMARSAYDSARIERNSLILLALKEGVRQAELARLTGLSTARIAQLQPKRRRRK